MTRMWSCLMIGCAVAMLGAGATEKYQPTKDEVKLAESTNEERKKKDLKPLKLNLALCKVARAHSENMARQEKMEHTLDDKTAFDRLRDAGYKYLKAAENIGFGERGATQAAVMKAWRESKGHSENMLNPDYTEIGIGIAKDKMGQLYYTQVFGKPRPK